MKTIFRNLFLFLAFVLTFMSCNEKEDIPSEKSLPVTNTTISGSWMLVELDGAPLAEGLYLYMSMDRKEQTFDIYTNYRSPFPQHQHGTFVITGSEYYGYEVSGSYGVIAGDWTHSYTVNYIYSSGTMLWTSKDDASATQLFKRVETIPEECKN